MDEDDEPNSVSDDEYLDEMSEYLQYEWHNTRDNHQIINDDTPSPSKPFSRYTSADKATSLGILRTTLPSDVLADLKRHGHDTDAFLTKFLQARKYSVPETVRLLVNHTAYRRQNGAVFDGCGTDAVDVRLALAHGLPGVLTSKDRKGRCVLVLYAANWDTDAYTLLTVYRSLLATLDVLTDDVHNQNLGFVVIVDWTDFSVRQCGHLRPAVVRLMIDGLQNCYPAKFKGVHFIAQPWYVQTALVCVKSFLLAQKSKQRIYVHGNNLSTLHDFVHRDILPTELGGEQPSYNPEVWLKRLAAVTAGTDCVAEDENKLGLENGKEKRVGGGKEIDKKLIGSGGV